MVDKTSLGAVSTKQTLVEEGTHFKGSLSSTCPVVVRGKIEGDVGAPSLNVSTSGAVHGKVKVSELRSAGELSGEFEADLVQLSGSIKDATIIRAKSLEVKLTQAAGMQVVFGDCTLDIGDPPTKEAVLRASGSPATEAAKLATDTSRPLPSVRPKVATKSELPAKEEDANGAAPPAKV